jgi:hypothetical protein
MVPFAGFPHGLIALPIAPDGLVGALDLHAAFGLGLASVVFTFFFVDFFDATGTLVALANKAGVLDAAGNMPRARRTFAMDGLAAVIGAFLGTSTTTAYVESASGIEEGGRTGLVAVTVGVLFVASIVFWPLAAAIPAAATAPALIVVGALDARRTAHDRLGRLRDPDLELSHRRDDAADVLDRERRELRRDQLRGDHAAQRPRPQGRPAALRRRGGADRALRVAVRLSRIDTLLCQMRSGRR